ncbi:pro-sigmaK processing inhibitor BofA family protein [Alkalithermobacter paradoxus]|uniref:SigmaK-factor processing regulatory protein BofA n=1 Tax=Alkalithermobacter paradoxus TaxID=29349 RepID=A0A1V4I3S3_9FIRM|nr:sigmaK-factor processing regulatory protein BofA [[Clostridium] thermoalcaliphilum]
MNDITQIKLLIVFGATLLSIYTIVLLLIGPLNFLGRFIFRILVGGLSLFILNQGLTILGVDLNLGVNLATSFIAGHLGVIGVCAMVLIRYLLIV